MRMEQGANFAARRDFFLKNDLPSGMKVSRELELWTIERRVVWFEAMAILLYELERPISIVLFGAGDDNQYDAHKMILNVLQAQDSPMRACHIESAFHGSHEYLPDSLTNITFYEFHHGLGAIPEQRKKLVNFLRNHFGFDQGTIVGVYAKPNFTQIHQDLETYIIDELSGDIEHDQIYFQWTLQQAAARRLECSPPQAEEFDFFFTT